MNAPERDELAAAIDAMGGALPMPVGTADVALSPGREQEIRAREQAATPGPWESDGAEIYGTLGGVLMIDLWVGETLDIDNQEQSNADAAFIAAARSAVPVLLAEVDRLRAQVVELEAQAEKVAAFCGQRAEYITALLNCHSDNKQDYDRWQGHAAARRQLSELLGLPVAWPAEAKPEPRRFLSGSPLEDQHESPLHHTYETPRDLPEVTR